MINLIISKTPRCCTLQQDALRVSLVMISQAGTLALQVGLGDDSDTERWTPPDRHSLGLGPPRDADRGDCDEDGRRVPQRTSARPPADGPSQARPGRLACAATRAGPVDARGQWRCPPAPTGPARSREEAWCADRAPRVRAPRGRIDVGRMSLFLD